MPKDKQDEAATILVFAIIGIALLWTYVIQPAITWVQINLFWIVVSLITIIGLISLVLFINNREKMKLEAIKKIEQEKIELEKQKENERIEAEKRAFCESQKEKGLTLFVDRHGLEKWGTLKEVNDWKKEEEIKIQKETLFYKVKKSIKKFEPSKKWKNELPYHAELQGWLKQEFPDSVVEKQTGSSRPDIVIGEIAIEVKGPTNNQALNNLMSKCLKYSQHYNNVILVLFEPSFSERNYKELYKGLKKRFPEVELIRK